MMLEGLFGRRREQVEHEFENGAKLKNALSEEAKELELLLAQQPGLTTDEQNNLRVCITNAYDSARDLGSFFGGRGTAFEKYAEDKEAGALRAPIRHPETKAMDEEVAKGRRALEEVRNLKKELLRESA